MPVPHFPSGNPNRSWTFANFVNWINSQYPGGGQQFINWIRNNNTVPPPYALNLNSRTFGPGGFGSNNTAYAWFSTWFAQEIVGKGIATKLGQGIQGGSQLIPKALKGAGEGIGQTPGAKLLTNPLSILGDFLTQRSLWVRIAEGVLGAGFLVIAAAKIGGNSQVGKTAQAIGSKVKIL